MIIHLYYTFINFWTLMSSATRAVSMAPCVKILDNTLNTAIETFCHAISCGAQDYGLELRLF